mgnify:CR=1 FL=1
MLVARQWFLLIVPVRVVKYFNTLDGHFLILHYAPPIGFVDQFGTFFVCVDLVVVVEVPLELEDQLTLPHFLHCPQLWALRPWTCQPPVQSFLWWRPRS